MTDIDTAAPPRLRAFAWIVIGTLAAVAVAHLLAIVAAFRAAPVEGRVVSTATNAGLSALTSLSLLDGARLLVLAAFIVWLYLARDIVERRGGGNWRKGWTIGGWFVPLANIAIPYLVVRDVYLHSAPDRSLASTRLVTAWWVALLVSLVSVTDTTTFADGTTQVHTPLPLAAVTGGAGILAALAAAALVRRVTGWQISANGVATH